MWKKSMPSEIPFRHVVLLDERVLIVKRDGVEVQVEGDAALEA
jgi:hypothetical protein